MWTCAWSTPLVKNGQLLSNSLLGRGDTIDPLKKMDKGRRSVALSNLTWYSAVHLFENDLTPWGKWVQFRRWEINKCGITIDRRRTKSMVQLNRWVQRGRFCAALDESFVVTWTMCMREREGDLVMVKGACGLGMTVVVNWKQWVSATAQCCTFQNNVSSR